MAKIKNAPPSVVLVDADILKLSVTRFIDLVLHDEAHPDIAVIVLAEPPKKEKYLDELATGRVQFLSSEKDEETLYRSLARALNYSCHDAKAEFSLKFLAPGDHLIREGEKGESVFIVKQGRLRAYRKVSNKEVTVGFIETGEFVREMAYIRGEPRSADVVAMSECELIEVPVATLEHVLFKRPSWTKSLMVTLSKRLKKANDEKV
ncbi:cyclic nucleotide-binding domain-containing protein [Bdellovibrionota bacterium FG-2]